MSHLSGKDSSMNRVLILDRGKARRSKNLGDIGEELTPCYLEKAGFSEIQNLNVVKRNYPYADFLAIRD
jgi:hypothetical protein